MPKKLYDAECQEIIRRYTTPLPDGTWIGTTTLGREYDVTENAIQAMLRRRGITLRTTKEAHANGKRCKPITHVPKDDAPLCKCGCGTPTQWNRAKNRWNNYDSGHQHPHKPYREYEWLYEQYITRKRTSGQIAQEFGVNKNTIVRFLRKLNITRRGNSEAQIGVQAGAKNAAWKGGTTPERQRLYKAGHWQELVKQIYARDHYTCQRCDAPKKGYRGLHVHHLRPWADAPNLRFDPANLITFCRACHEWVHSTANINNDFLR